ncbi:hypothetical protein [Methylobacterium indicum]|uniref:hypothetical protein n=1 Tax=Methylobacterium indicum TaxID=1775910 RepID=UPI000AE988BE|nr:hypothetical protein [Methylobacterium indicum]
MALLNDARLKTVSGSADLDPVDLGWHDLPTSPALAEKTGQWLSRHDSDTLKAIPPKKRASATRTPRER